MGDDELGACPSEDQISAFVGNRLDDAARAELEQHFDGCAPCRQLVANLVRIYSLDMSSPSMVSPGTITCTDGGGEGQRSGPELLVAGSSVGRYRTLECVGMGGMGVVYAAYDPQLDRRVALKLLIDGAGKHRDRKRARLMREAQSMAKLAHPNVIIVHDVGIWHGQVFVAMEFVEGRTLKTWMREGRRSWSELRDTMLAAGRGLAAAHAAGLVHRDFKPDNVLIGRDGQVRVTDFGLARWEDGVMSTGQQLLSASGEDSLSNGDTTHSVLSVEVSLTRTGALVGTPAYMAPELYDQEVADAASDQYAYCVALYEALYGKRPFHGETLAELAAKVSSSDKAAFSSSVNVPRHVRNALRRGLSRNRADRFPSMDALLAVLERRGVRRWWGALALTVPVAAVGVGAWSNARQEVVASGCDDAGAPIRGVWTPERRQTLQKAFARVDTAARRTTALAMAEQLDHYADRWEETARGTCEVRSARGRTTYVALSERCLARSRIALDVALRGFEVVEDGDLGRASAVVASLPSGCDDESVLLSEAPPLVPHELTQDVADVRLALARVDGHEIAGEYREGVALARSLNAKADAIGHAPLRAESKLALGQLLDLAGDYEAAAQMLEDAELLATASRYHRVTALALASASYVHGVMLHQHERGRRLARRARAVGLAASMDPSFQASLLLNQAAIEFSSANYTDAEAFAVEALALRDRDDDPLRWADAAYNLASIRLLMGQEEQAIGTLREYIDVFEAHVGRIHPDVALGYHTLGVALVGIGHEGEGEVALRTALEIVELTLGGEHPRLANPLSDLADLEARRGEFGRAIALGQRAMALRKAHHAEPLLAAKNRLEIAGWMAEQGAHDDALIEGRRAVEEAAAILGKDDPALVDFLYGRARVFALAGAPARARDTLDEARALIDPVDIESLNAHATVEAELSAKLVRATALAVRTDSSR